jgi:NADH:ubiquinone oxidoreductase subunit C
MTIEEIQKTIGEKLGAKALEISVKSPRQMFVTVAPENLIEAMRFFKQDIGLYHLSTITGRDSGEKLEALYHLAMEGLELTVRSQTDRANPKLPTITPVYPGAVFYEREVHDLVGIDIEGHPDLRPLVLPEDWPQGVHPLRKDWKYNREKGAIE